MDISSISTLNGYETAVDESSTSFYYSITDQDSTLKDTDIDMMEKNETPLKNVTQKFRNNLKLQSSTPLNQNLKDSSIMHKSVNEVSKIKMEVDDSIMIENDVKTETDDDTAKTVIEKTSVEILVTDCDEEKENISIKGPIDENNLSVPVRHTRKSVAATVESLKKTVATGVVKMKKTVTIAAGHHTMSTRRRSVVSSSIQTTIKKISTFEEIQPTKRQSISTTFRQKGRKSVLPGIKAIKEEEDEPVEKRTRKSMVPVATSKIVSSRKSTYKPVVPVKIEIPSSSENESKENVLKPKSVKKTVVNSSITSSSENESKKIVREPKSVQKVKKNVVTARKTTYKRKSGNLLIPAKTTVNAGKRKSFGSTETVSTKNYLQSRKSVIPSRVSRKTIFSSSPAPRSLRRSVFPQSSDANLPEKKKSPLPQKISRKSIFSSSTSVSSKNVIPAPVAKPASFTEPTIFKCDHCTKTFRLKSTFANHVKSHAIKKSSSALSCSFCDKGFSIKTALDNHLMIHCTKISAFERRKLSSPSRLAVKSKANVKNVSTAASNHSVLYRTPSKTISCRKCNLKFLDIIKYHEHMASHGGEEE